MKSISVKIRNAIMMSMFIVIFLFTAISLLFIYTQNSKFTGINEQASGDLSEFTDTVINENIKLYISDITTACGEIIDGNYNVNKDRGDAVANYVKSLYEKGDTTPKDLSYGIGFIGGTDSAKLNESYMLGDIRQYIFSIPGYDSTNLDALDIFVVTKSGIVFDGTNENLGTDYRDLRNDSWYIDAFEAGKPVWTDVIVGSVTGDKKIDYVVPLIIDNEFMGVTVVSAPLTEIYNTLLNVDFKGVRDVILTDSKGERIAGSEEYSIDDVGEDDIVFKGDYCMSRYSVAQAGSTVYFVFDVADVMSAVNEIEGEIRDNGRSIKEYSFNFIVTAVVIYIFFALVFVVVSFMFSDKTSKKLVRPVLLLSSKVENFGKGNMDINVDDINTNDEVGLLAEKFSVMSKDIKEYLNEITEITAEKERFKTEMDAAAKIQLSLMSGDFPKSSDYDVYAYMKPARSVGGDLYAVIPVDSDNILVAVADVAGKGIPASLFSVRTKVYLQIYGEMGLKPSEILANVNNRLCENNDEAIFVTAFLGILNEKTGRFTYSNAGHNRPVVTGSDVSWLNMPKGLPLGCMEGISYSDAEIYFKKGQGIFIYSDGVTEAVGKDNTFYGDDRLIDKLSYIESESAKNIINIIKEDIRNHYNGSEQWDDITMLSLRYTKE